MHQMALHLVMEPDMVEALDLVQGLETEPATVVLLMQNQLKGR